MLGVPRDEPKETLKQTKETLKMYAAASNNVIAAGFSLVISAALFAYAIIPASPSVMV